MTSPSATPAGWYADPSAPASAPARRYWDGESWTEHLAPAFTPLPEPTTPDGVPLGDPAMRVVAYFVDGLVVGAVAAVLGSPFLVLMTRAYVDFIDQLSTLSSRPGSEDQLAGQELDFFGSVVGWYAAFAVLSLVVVLAYHVLMLRLRSATVGLRAVGLEVRLRDRPGRLSWGTAIRRAVAQYLPLNVPLLGTVYLVVDLVSATNDKVGRQTLHDRFAGTSVVKVPTSA